MPNVVINFQYGTPEQCIQSILSLQQELNSNRSGDDIYLRYNLKGTLVNLHVQRHDLYVTRFHLNDTQPWCILKDNTKSLRDHYLGIGEGYGDLTPSRAGIEVGFRRFESALYDIIKRFKDDGANVSNDRGAGDRQKLVWNFKLGGGLASLIFMSIETCRFYWLFYDFSRLFRECPEQTRTVGSFEGGTCKPLASNERS